MFNVRFYKHNQSSVYWNNKKLCKIWMPDFSWKSECGTDLDICSSEGNNTPELTLGRLWKGTGFAPFLQGANVLNFCLHVFAQLGSIQFFKIFLISVSVWGWELGLKTPSKIYNNNSCKKWPYIIPGFNGSLRIKCDISFRILGHTVWSS